MITVMTEICRHLRPQFINNKNMTLQPNPMGGVSFLMRPTAEKQYDFWVYVCPPSIAFSSKQAVKSLRDKADSGIVPYGTITLDGRPLLDQLIEYVKSNHHGFPSEIPKQVDAMVTNNSRVRIMLEMEKLAARGSIHAYQDNQ